MPKDYQDDYDNLIAQGDIQLRDGSMPVWYKDRFLKISEFHRYLSGALVEVIFNVKHFLVAPNQKFNKVGSNTYSGQLQQITILDLGPSDSPNPFSQRQGPLRINQQSPLKPKEAQSIQPQATVPEDSQSTELPLPVRVVPSPAIPELSPNSASTLSGSDTDAPPEFIEGSSTLGKRKDIADVEPEVEVNDEDEAEAEAIGDIAGIEQRRSVKKRRRVQ